MCVCARVGVWRTKEGNSREGAAQQAQPATLAAMARFQLQSRTPSSEGAQIELDEGALLGVRGCVRLADLQGQQESEKREAGRAGQSATEAAARAARPRGGAAQNLEDCCSEVPGVSRGLGVHILGLRVKSWSASRAKAQPGRSVRECGRSRAALRGAGAGETDLASKHAQLLCNGRRQRACGKGSRCSSASSQRVRQNEASARPVGRHAAGSRRAGRADAAQEGVERT